MRNLHFRTLFFQYNFIVSFRSMDSLSQAIYLGPYISLKLPTFLPLSSLVQEIADPSKNMQPKRRRTL